MKIVTWNLNSRTNEETLKGQFSFIRSGDFDVITLQEVTLNSELFFKESFKDMFVLSSFDLVKDKSILVRNRKYGQIIISKQPIKFIPEQCIEIPFPERLLSGFIESTSIEIHTTHVPPGSSNGVIKVEHFEGLFNYLSKRKDKNMILTGDFNSPKLELDTGEIITWGQKIGASGKTRISVNPKWKHQCTGERWDLAERNIIENHKELGLRDAFRIKNGYQDSSGSWFTNKGQGRRYDHIFPSENLIVNSAFYNHEPREEKLSDHSPLIAELSIR
ncbi:endonuclease/exonuclease/phosphatase family protein [Gammaproteobacteria bacterium]|nr:endonuclease/exonuclease/phosphatase family protein [Gammaproteobacteria bacterium]